MDIFDAEMSSIALGSVISNRPLSESIYGNALLVFAENGADLISKSLRYLHRFSIHIH
jgi:hypothetical protein